MMNTIARSILRIYLSEKRIPTTQDFPANDISSYIGMKDAIFVTLYYAGGVIASSGRIQCKKENSLLECIENTLLCLKDSRFSSNLQSVDELDNIKIRVDRFSAGQRRIIQNISDLIFQKEGIILLSQKFGKMSIVLPNIANIASSPEDYLSIALKKAAIDGEKNLQREDYIIYGLETIIESDF